MPHDDEHDAWVLAEQAAAALRDRFGSPPVVIVAGSGWAGAGAALGTVEQQQPSTSLPGVPAPTVLGHEGLVQLVTTTRGAQVLVLSGRSHLYEGHPAHTVVHLVRAAVLAGASTVVLTNAAGSLHTEVGPGEVVLISDHLNLTGTDAMVGAAPPERFGSRFVDATRLYDPALRAELVRRRPTLTEGVYAGLRGGSFETPAEIRMLAALGADLVGMSTVLEAVAAHHLGARVLGLSLVTNLAAGLQDHVDHAEVLDVASRSTDGLVGVLDDVVELAAPV